MATMEVDENESRKRKRETSRKLDVYSKVEVIICFRYWDLWGIIDLVLSQSLRKFYSRYLENSTGINLFFPHFTVFVSIYSADFSS